MGAGRRRGLLAGKAEKGCGGRWGRAQTSDAQVTRLGFGSRGAAAGAASGGQGKDVAVAGPGRRSLARGSRSWRTLHAVLPTRYTQLGHAARSFDGTLNVVGARYTQLGHAARSFGAFGARCTQFYPTVHADEVRCTQLFSGPERRASSSTCGFDASRSFRGIKNCVKCTSAACSVGKNCVYRTHLRVARRQNCVYRTPTA